MSTIAPDVILLDMAMPGLSGDEVLRHLRQQGVETPVILMTGRPEAAGSKFFDVIEKPFDFTLVARVVAAAVEQGRSASA